MAEQAPPTLHVVISASASALIKLVHEVGRFAGLAIKGDASQADAVLVIGSADEARDVAAILGRPVDHRPMPRVRTNATIRRAIEQSARSAGVARVRVWRGRVPAGTTLDSIGSAQLPDPGDIDFSILPDRASARCGLDLADATVIVPLTDRPELVDARTLMFVTGVLELIGQTLGLVLPTQSRRLGEAMSYHRGAGLKSPVRLVDHNWIGALPAADVFVEPIDAGLGFSTETGRSLASWLGVPIAVTAAWHLDPDAATNSLPAEIRATVAPVLQQARAVVALETVKS